MATLFLLFWRTLKLLSMLVSSVHTPPSDIWEAFLLSAWSPMCFICSFFNDDHSGWCKVIPHYGFDLRVSNNEQCWVCFVCLLAICMSSLEKCLSRYSAHFVLDSLLCCCWDIWTTCVFWKLSPCQLHHSQVFPPVCSLSFWFDFFAEQKLVHLIRSHLLTFIFISFALEDWPKKTVVQLMSENICCVLF